MKNYRAVYLIGVLLLFASRLWAAPGDLDPSFAGSGKFTFGLGSAADIAHAVKVQPDGKLVVVGRSDTGSKAVFAVARYHPDGSRDNSFGGDGDVLTNIPEAVPGDDNVQDDAHSLAIQTDGKIVVAGGAGQQTGDSDFAIVRYNPDGSLDPSFGGTGIITTNFGGFDVAYEVRLQADGKIVVGGYKDGALAVMRLNPNGTPDTTFNGTGKVTTIVGPSANRGPRTGMALMSDNKIVMAGSGSGFNGFIVVRYNVDGSLDNSFHTDGKVITPVFQSGQATSVAIQRPTNLLESEKIVVGGYAFNGSEEVFAAVRYNIDGELDTSFDADGIVTTVIPDWTQARSFSVAVEGTTLKQPRKIVLGGLVSDTTTGGVIVSQFATVRYNVNGSLDSTFDQDGIALAPFNNRAAGAGLVLSAGKIIVVGETITSSPPDVGFAIVRYNSDGSFDNTLDGDGTRVDQLGDKGAFCRGITVQPDGKIVLAGSSGGDTPPHLGVARLNTDGTLDNSFGLEGKVRDPRDWVQGNATTVQKDGKIVVVGHDIISGDFAVARYNPNGLRDNSFDGDGFVTIQVTPAPDSALAVAMQPDGKILIAGSGAGSINNRDVALVRLNPNGSLDGSFDFDGKILIGLSLEEDIAYAVALQPNGRILVAGSSGENPSRFFLARFNPNGTPDNSFSGDGVAFTSVAGGDAAIRALSVLPSGEIVVAGHASNGTNFDFAVARYQSNGSLDPTFHGGAPVLTPIGSADDLAHALVVQPDGRLLVAGGTTPHFVNGNVSPNTPVLRANYALARYNFDGSLDVSYGSGGKRRVPFGSGRFEQAYGLALDSSGNAVVAGEVGEIFGVARLQTGPLLPTILANISTRLRVGTADNALFGGMIATGTGGKKVMIRAIGPTLTDFGLPGALQDPTLELFQGNASVAKNDNWRNSAQQAEIASSGLAPNKEAEAAIIATLTPNQNYTAIVSGKNGQTGIGVVEAFDLEQTAASKLANISTRGFVDVDDNVMIAGVIIRPAGGANLKVLVRALGPTLGDFGVGGFLANPTLDLVNASGTVLRSNDSWKSSQAAQIQAANLAPKYDAEAALIHTLSPGQYTAVVRGSGRTTGVGLVEVYNIP